MKTAIIVIVLVVAGLLGFGLWQNHTNSLAYQLRNCKEISDNGPGANTFIGFQCAGYTDYVPYGERADVYADLSHYDQQGGPTMFVDYTSGNNQ